MRFGWIQPHKPHKGYHEIDTQLEDMAIFVTTLYSRMRTYVIYNMNLPL